jgi:hypothetical protein
MGPALTGNYSFCVIDNPRSIANVAIFYYRNLPIFAFV